MFCLVFSVWVVFGWLVASRGSGVSCERPEILSWLLNQSQQALQSSWRVLKSVWEVSGRPCSGSALRKGRLEAPRRPEEMRDASPRPKVWGYLILRAT